MQKWWFLAVKGIGGGSRIRKWKSLIYKYIVALHLEFPKWAHLCLKSRRLKMYGCKREGWCRKMYRKSYTLQKLPNFWREPFFRATGWPDGHKNWYTASYGYYLGNNLGDFWFFDFLAFYGLSKFKIWAPAPKMPKIWAKNDQKKPKNQKIKNPLDCSLDNIHMKLCTNFYDHLVTQWL